MEETKPTMKSEKTATAPMTMPSNMSTTPMPAMPAEKTMEPKPAAGDMTHMLTMSEPYFTSYPATGAAPTGTWASGAKVLVMVPGATYSKVMAESGVVAYVGTKGLEPISKK
jgi:hypothetical protein